MFIESLWVGSGIHDTTVSLSSGLFLGTLHSQLFFKRIAPLNHYKVTQNNTIGIELYGIIKNVLHVVCVFGSWVY